MKKKESPRPVEYKYWAFISYSHKDSAWGDWLHEELETYRLPGDLVGTPGIDGALPERVYPVFRDREELPTSADLTRNIGEALEQSRSLIVICSPHAARSYWVDEEVRQFKKSGRGDRILCLIVDGEPNATDKKMPEKECFPPSLRFQLDAKGRVTKKKSEPMAADVRHGKDGRSHAKLKLVAGILGINYDSLHRRDMQREKKKKKTAFTMFAAVSLVLLAATGLGLFTIVTHRRAAVTKIIQSEVRHLARTAEESIGIDDLAMLEAMEYLKKRSHVRYAYILDRDETVIMGTRGGTTHFSREKFHDGTVREYSAKNPGSISEIEVPDPKQPKKKIYDFSMTLRPKFDRSRVLGYIIVGMGEDVYRQETAVPYRIFTVLFAVLIAGMAGCTLYLYRRFIADKGRS